MIKAGECLEWIGPYESDRRLPVFSNKTRKHRCVNPEHYAVKAIDTYNDEERPKIPTKPRIELTCRGPAWARRRGDSRVR